MKEIMSRESPLPVAKQMYLSNSFKYMSNLFLNSTSERSLKTCPGSMFPCFAILPMRKVF